MPQTPFSSLSSSPKRLRLTQQYREHFPLWYVTLIRILHQCFWAEIKKLPVRLSQNASICKAQKASSVFNANIWKSKSLLDFQSLFTSLSHVVVPQVKDVVLRYEHFLYVFHPIHHSKQTFTVQTAKAEPGPSLCTIPHPAGSLLSCVISADAAIEALREICTIVLSVECQQPFANQNKHVQNNPPFCTVHTGLSFPFLVLFLTSLTSMMNNPYWKGNEWPYRSNIIWWKH